jgi:hypothetical protein
MKRPQAPPDAIGMIRHLGYSEREAAFLYTVAIYSGYFLRRQFNFAVQRVRGAIATHFLRKSIQCGYVRETHCEPGRSLYHLQTNSVYRFAGQRNSHAARPKSLREIRRRLVTLDYVLASLAQEEFLDSQASRRRFFAQYGIKDEALTGANNFGELVPVSVRSETDLCVCFAFVDEGLRSTAKFERFIDTHDRLLCSLPNFEVVYVATIPELFREAQHLFKRRFPTHIPLQVVSERVAGFGSVGTKPPRAALKTELIKNYYPIGLNADPGYTAGYDEAHRIPQTLLFATDKATDTG